MGRMKEKNTLRKKRALRKRKKSKGTSSRPRLSLFRSLNHIYGQLIDDSTNRTLASLSSLCSEVQEEVANDQSKTEIAQKVGEKFGKKTKELGIERVKCDIGPYRFHGRIKAFVEAFQKSGIKL